jgi:hypothetical protein
MAIACTHLAFNIVATRDDAERFIKVIEAAAAIELSHQPRLAPEIEPAFRASAQSADATFAEILGGIGLGIDCSFDENHGLLGFYDIDGRPNLCAFAQCLQRLYPEKLPIGFVYSTQCDTHRPSGFGGGLFAVVADAIVHRTLDQLLAAELASLPGASGGR